MFLDFYESKNGFNMADVRLKTAYRSRKMAEGDDRGC
jgi:hypothetical protein